MNLTKTKLFSFLVACLSLWPAAQVCGQDTYDWTPMVKNPSFESGTTGWTVNKSVEGWNDLKISTGSAPDGNQYYNLWAQKVKTIGLSQTITLPAGNYTLSAQLRTNGSGLSDQNVYVTTSTGTKQSPALSVADAWTKLSVGFTLSKEETVTLGARGTGNGSNEKGWFCVDDFRLTGDQDPGADMDRTVAQVTEAVTLSGRGALHITGAKPFAVTGKVDIANTDHAVIFVDSLRPSEMKAWLAYITIKGQPAVSEKNCQLRLYDHGTVIYPYGKESKDKDGFHPLTVYAGQNLTGESCDRFGTENTNGFMNSLADSTLNNRIRSFRLKRGYMVTFSIQKGGWGYSRCFIADNEDLVVNTLPTILDQRISSYRIFRWNNVGKNGVANILNTNNLKKLNCTWTYAWGVGQELGTDYECVPHMNNLWSASTYSLGANDQSPYMKTDNEPANGNDPKPASVAQELQRWPELMRTGRRLLSPSSFDSGEWWHKQFLDSIDARGWRCDIVDIHSYWSEGSFNNIKANWADKFQRPVWITEFIWGASWSGGFGIFGVAKTNEQRGNPTDSILNLNRDVLARIWGKLNSYDYVERYAYWNDEWACSKILWNGNLTPAGEYYSKMKTGPSYSGTYNFVPRDWRLSASSDLKAQYDKTNGDCRLSWVNNNGDLTETMRLQRRKDSGNWEDIASFTRPDDHDMSYTDHLDEDGYYTYRVVDMTYKKTTLTSPTAAVSLANSVGTDDLQYGHLNNQVGDTLTVNGPAMTKRAVTFLGMPTYNNRTLAVVPRVLQSSTVDFKATLMPWKNTTSTSADQPEGADFIRLLPGQYQWGEMRAEVDTCRFAKADGSVSKLVKGDTVEVAFKQPFPIGVVPVVVAQTVSNSKTEMPIVAKVFDVTNTGFRIKLMKQNCETQAITGHQVFYMAITPGAANLDIEGWSIAAGRCEDTPVGGSLVVNCPLRLADGTALTLQSPRIVAAPQTHRLDYASVFRIQTSGSTASGTTAIGVIRQMDTSLKASQIGPNTATSNGDIIGWVAINHATLDPTLGIGELKQNNRKSSDNTYDLNGRKMPDGHLQPGVYVNNGKKIVVK